MGRLNWVLKRASITLGLLVFLCNCGPKKVPPVSPLDNPEHHYKNGTELYEKGSFEQALNEFNRAKELDPKYSPAYVGMGLVLAERKDFEAALNRMKEAQKQARNNQDYQVIAAVGLIRLYTAWQVDDWLDKAKDQFAFAQRISPDSPAPYYYMGLAYKATHKLDKAAELFRRVISLNQDYVAQADQEWAAIQKMQRAEPETGIGKAMAAIEKIDRADMAALLIEELKLEKLFNERDIPISQKKESILPKPTDYQDHKLKADIERVIRLDIRGLEPFADNVFGPDKEINRANFALMIEDILLKVTGEKGLASKFIGSPSPFKDVDSSYYAFNAIMVCTTRGIMEADLEGNFRKDDPVSGAEALLALRRLKERLK